DGVPEASIGFGHVSIAVVQVGKVSDLHAVSHGERKGRQDAGAVLTARTSKGVYGRGLLPGTSNAAPHRWISCSSRRRPFVLCFQPPPQRSAAYASKRSAGMPVCL